MYCLVPVLFILYTEVKSRGTIMKITHGPFSFDRDLDQARLFLREIYKQTGALHYLIPTKIENQKFGPCGEDYSPKDDEAFRIWRIPNKDESGIVALSHRGSAGNYHKHRRAASGRGQRPGLLRRPVPGWRGPGANL